MSRTLTQIVPALPPATNGVGDYALGLARIMRQDFGLNTVFVVGSDRWQGPDQVEDFRVSKLPARSAGNLEALLEAIQMTSSSSSVILQLSIYGYAARGCPIWLLEGLKRWKSKQPDSQLVTMFHELYASGPPWRSAFWLSILQQRICAHLARLSNIAVTNISLHRERLERFDSSKRERIPVLATPSNVGELLVSTNARAKKMVVFGLTALRKQTYESKMDALRQACQRLGITEILDVGAMFDGIPDHVGDIPVTKHGFMDPADLSSLLSSSLAGFLDYSAESLGKSGVFAAYCAHRLVPVVPVTHDHGASEADGITCGVHYYNVEGNREHGFLPDIQSIADAAWTWYQGHSLRCHARTFADMILS
jgi:hypothetical protein